MLWNTENELNWVPLGHTFLGHWRPYDDDHKAWRDCSFLMGLLSALVEGIHEGSVVWSLEGPQRQAAATMNINVSVDSFLDIATIGIPVNLMFDVAYWSSATDIVGLGIYYNYFIGCPEIGSVLSAKLPAIVAASTKPVMIMEAGYSSTTYLASETCQEAYLTNTANAALAFDLDGLFWFTLNDRQIDPSPQGFEGGWGLLGDSPPWGQKPVYDAYRQLISGDGAPSQAVCFCDGVAEAVEGVAHTVAGIVQAGVTEGINVVGEGVDLGVDLGFGAAKWAGNLYFQFTELISDNTNVYLGDGYSGVRVFDLFIQAEEESGDLEAC